MSFPFDHVEQQTFEATLTHSFVGNLSVLSVKLVDDLRFDSEIDIATLVHHPSIRVIKAIFGINNCIQVVGDVDYWDPEKIKLVEHELRYKLCSNEFSHINYGYTGRIRDNSYGVNTMVSRIADKNEAIAKKLIANVVSFHTPHAIKNWGCTTSNSCTKFVCVGPDAKFGDDIIITDLMCGEIICVEGGIQSFRQVLNMLILDRRVPLIHGCRTEESARYFSCSRFLNYCREFK